MEMGRPARPRSSPAALKWPRGPCGVSATAGGLVFARCRLHVGGQGEAALPQMIFIFDIIFYLNCFFNPETKCAACHAQVDFWRAAACRTHREAGFDKKYDV